MEEKRMQRVPLKSRANVSGAGLTLIEMSMVLVTIALLIAGILGGKELIRITEIRKTISQKEKFETATQSFKLKYNCLPADCTNGTSFGITSPGSIHHGTNQNGDGNGQILGGSSHVWGSTMYPANTESTMYWRYLQQTRFITDTWGGRVSGNHCAQSNPGVISPSPPIVQRRIDTGCGVGVEKPGGWALFSSNGRNRNSSASLQFSGHIYVLTETLWCCSSENIVTPSDSYAVDAKIDDGLPRSGKVRVFSGNVVDRLYSPSAGGAGSSSCINSSVTPNVYNVTNSRYLCALVLQASF